MTEEEVLLFTLPPSGSNDSTQQFLNFFFTPLLQNSQLSFVLLGCIHKPVELTTEYYNTAFTNGYRILNKRADKPRFLLNWQGVKRLKWKPRIWHRAFGMAG